MDRVDVFSGERQFGCVGKLKQRLKALSSDLQEGSRRSEVKVKVDVSPFKRVFPEREAPNMIMVYKHRVCSLDHNLSISISTKAIQNIIVWLPASVALAHSTSRFAW